MILQNDQTYPFLLQSGEEDVSQFDTKFTKQTPVDSPDDSCLSESVNQIFSVRYLMCKKCVYMDVQTDFKKNSCHYFFITSYRPESCPFLQSDWP